MLRFLLATYFLENTEKELTGFSSDWRLGRRGSLMTLCSFGVARRADCIASDQLVSAVFVLCTFNDCFRMGVRCETKYCCSERIAVGI
jgi:hypothetical protein